LRCRPELAPGFAPVDANHRLVLAAIRKLEEDSLGETGVNGLAGSLGVTDRHLRRVLRSVLGVTPIQVAQTQRLLLAKRLLTDTNLPVIEVAYASGFSSLRRFNALFRERYKLPPTKLRRAAHVPMDQGRCLCTITYRVPFDWKSLLEFFAPRIFGGVERIVDGRYYRTVEIGQRSGWIMVENKPSRSELQVEVSSDLLPVLMQVLNRVRRLFDLEAVPERIVDHLGSIAYANPGLRVPGAFDGFEMGVRAILGQQISVRAATTLAGRLTCRFGKTLTTSMAGLTHLSPTPSALAKAEISELMSLGMTKSRAASIIALARAVAGREITLDVAVSIEDAIQKLTQLPGVGDWTAHYFAMRAYGWPDAFPASDLGILKALKVKKSKDALKAAEKWRPWRAYAAIHLWKSLESKK
jgi:AraC family transcriptional regulator of adaptative response / DNA-3-methyladenine glycosylase II